MSTWPIINDPKDLPEDGRYDRMYAEWLVAEGIIDREDFDLQVRLTEVRRSARLESLKDWEAIQARDAKKNCDIECSGDHKIHTNGVVSWMTRTVPLKRGRHSK
jgi:hypothetical protein